MMTEAMLDYFDGETACEAFVAHGSGTAKRPCVLVAHQWAGQTEHERNTARAMADLGYVGIAIDVYGKGVRGTEDGDNSPLMMPFLQDRAALRQRLLAAVAMAKAHPLVDASRIAITGYCFGGLCALDIARSGTTDVKGAVSIHGIFAPPGLGAQPPISTKVMILHGWDDPMAKPDDVVGVARELTDAGADWQLHAYGHALHAFTAKGANTPDRGIKYDANADKRSWRAMVDFFAEIFS